MTQTNISKFLAPLMLFGIFYLVIDAYFLTEQQGSFAKTVEIFLLIAFAASAFFGKFSRRILLGISRKRLPLIQEVDCSTLKSAECIKTCTELKGMLECLENSGALRSKKRTIRKLLGYGAGLGGLILAVPTSLTVLSALGVSFSFYGVMDMLKQNRKYWEHWEKKEEHINELFEKYKHCFDPEMNIIPEPGK